MKALVYWQEYHGRLFVMRETILQTRQLGKRYGKRWAVKNLNLEVRCSDVFGFLGPNGAGKSTTIRMILSLIKPTEGATEIFGHSLKSHRSEALRRVGGIVEKPDFYQYLSAYKNLEIVGALSGDVKRKRIFEVLDLVGLSDRATDRVKTYSHGMKQRLGIAQALISDPELVILDEPTNGLDPQGMKEVRDLIVHLSRDQKKTIILSSHLLNEIEMVANRMAIIHNGELVVQGDVNTLLDEGEKYVILYAEPRQKVLSVLKRQKRILKNISEKEGRFEVIMDFALIPELNKALVGAGVHVRALIPRRSLEDLFLSMTERAT
jgi:ABC-type multidrug transport system ATPase subunit